jgi:phosphoglycerate dehydrogenase-like enzyme
MSSRHPAGHQRRADDRHGGIDRRPRTGLDEGDAILINVARGEIVDEAALYAHLVAHAHFFAGIGAWWVEPVRHGRFAMGHPFLDLPNVIGSPHNSAGGGAWRDEYLRRTVQNCRRAILGETPWNLIGPDEWTL